MDVVWSTGSRVKRYSWFDGPFYEELSMKKEHVQLDRMNKGAPLLNNHGTWNGGLRDILGVVVQGSAKVVKGEGRAKVQFSKRAEIADLIEDIKSGVIRNLSVGYRVDKLVEVDEETEDGAPVFRAESWEPMEISFVTVPADADAQSRNQPMADGHEAIIERKASMAKRSVKPLIPKKRNPGNPVHTEDIESKGEGEDLDQDLENVDDEGGDDLENIDEGGDDLEGVDDEGGEGGDQDDLDDVDDEGAEGEDEGEVEEAKPKKSAKKATKKATKKAKGKRSLTADDVRSMEAKRQETIRKNVRAAGLSEELADTLTKDTKISVKEAGQRIFAELAKRSSNPTMNQRIEVTMNQQTARRGAAVRGILSRYDESKHKLKQDGDQEFRQGSLLAVARHFLSQEGVRDAYTMSNTDVAQRSLHTSSDFANVLADVSNTTLREGYESIPATYKQFTAQKSVSNFKEIRSVEISNGGRLEKVNEHGEYRRTSLLESAQAYRLEKFGIVIGKTWELIVNDDLGALTDVSAKLGRRARELENITFWELIMSNPVMADGNAFFSLAHGNLGTAGVPSVTTIGEARAKMRVQRDLDGELIQGLTPDWFVNPAALETAVEMFLAPTNPNQTSQVNPFTGKFKQMTEALLDANSLTAYYLFADKVKRAIAEMALLDNKGPEIFTREGFNVDGMETKIRYVFGMSLVDWRGAYKNAGA